MINLPLSVRRRSVTFPFPHHLGSFRFSTNSAPLRGVNVVVAPLSDTSAQQSSKEKTRAWLKAGSWDSRDPIRARIF